MHSFKRWQLEAFSLIEIAIALVIIGIVAWTGQKALQTLVKIKEQQTTNARFHDVQEALRAYFARNNRLPCPAQPNSNGAASTHDAGCVVNPGLIPYADLGLSRNHQVDGCARLILYGVAPGLAASGALTPGPILCELDSESGIVIHKNLSSPANQKFPIAYVLISFGRKGGSPFDRACEPTLEEMENDSSDLTFIEAAGSDFRHQLVWKAADILAIEVYGKACRPKEKAVISNTWIED